MHDVCLDSGQPFSHPDQPEIATLIYVIYVILKPMKNPRTRSVLLTLRTNLNKLLSSRKQKKFMPRPKEIYLFFGYFLVKKRISRISDQVGRDFYFYGNSQKIKQASGVAIGVVNTYQANNYITM